MQKYSPELKLQVVQAYLSGEGSYRALAKEYGIQDWGSIRIWVYKYKQKGEAGLERSRTNRRYPLELKLKAVELHAEGKLSLRAIARQLGISGHCQIADWAKILATEGVSGLRPKDGKADVDEKKPKLEHKRKPSHPLVEDEKDRRIKELEYELRLAKIKNEYLEQLRSLGQAKGKKKQESSTDSVTNTN